MTDEGFADFHLEKGYERGMTFMGRKKASEETGRIPANQNFYLSESFFGTMDTSISMKELAPALLSAKSAEEMEVIYRQKGVEGWSFGHDGDLLSNIFRCFYKKRLGFDDPVPFYSKWLFYIVQTTSACLDLYKVCLRVVRSESNKSSVSNIMDMLYFADIASQQMHSEVDRKKRMLWGLPTESMPLHFDYRDIPKFPLLSVFNDLQREHGENLQETYGITYYQRKLDEEFRYLYWNNPNAKCELKKLLWSYAANSATEDKKYLLKFDDQALAEKILSLLDNHTELRLSSNVCIKINSVAGETNAISWHIDTALFLWVVTQVQNTEDYRICKICGQIFRVGSQKTRQYCDVHKKASVDYFNKKLRKLEQETDDHEEEEHIIVV